jgi:hypothetical protein
MCCDGRSRCHNGLRVRVRAHWMSLSVAAGETAGLERLLLVGCRGEGPFGLSLCADRKSSARVVRHPRRRARFDGGLGLPFGCAGETARTCDYAPGRFERRAGPLGRVKSR